jgi:hypothetical protein
VLHPLRELLLLVLSATLAGMENFVEIKLWGEQRLDFLRRLYPYERGAPLRALRSYDALVEATRASNSPPKSARRPRPVGADLKKLVGADG